MIIKGNSRAGAGDLAKHLLRSDTNEKITVMETFSVNPDPAQALRESIKDMQIQSTGTRGVKGLYHANIDPATDYAMTDDQWLRAVEVLGKELGLDGQPRAIVKHQKEGREHLHVVWQRTDTEQWKFITDSLNYPAHERASRQLEREFNHELVRGAFTGREPGHPRPISELSHEDWQKMERSGLNPKERRGLVRELFEQSDSGEAFKGALNEHGFLLAKGKRSPFVIVDQAGEIHALRSEFIKIYKAKEIYARIDDVRDKLPTVEQAKALQLERVAPDGREKEPEPVIDEVSDRSTTPDNEIVKPEPTTETEIDKQPKEQDEPLDQKLLVIKAGHDRQLRALAQKHDDQMADLKSQQSDDEIRYRQKLEDKISKEEDQVFQDIMKRKVAMPDKLSDEQKQQWNKIEKELSPRRLWTRKKTKIAFWKEIQPILEAHQDQQRQSFEKRLLSQNDYEISNLFNEQSQEKDALTDVHQNDIDFYLSEKKRLEAQAERKKEITRQMEELERQREKDRDRGRDDR